MLGWAKALLVSGLAFLLPIKALVLGAVVLVVLNTATDVWRARREGQRITAKWWSRPVAKLVCWPLAITVGHVVGAVMLSGLVPVAGIVAGAVGTYELGSCLRNVSALTGADITEAVIARVSAAIEPKKVEAARVDHDEAA
jgi:hypothetical protein